ncbi:glycosyltransferase [Thioclava pacifica]|uniref:Glycosyltransferase 2-like domain-containing protein n=1 Tax=Thioclava pacifica DSM 10166 TaxID=1353537 RepID=A0A074JD48_9RHOB|nr:glycosyltransferase [Thioclava pacifica]KEO53533.1 hypothetical protein TP2_17615 [Thioclava pacifica DSM 10166]
MLGRFLRIFDRFVESNLRIVLRVPDLSGLPGRIERIELRRNRLRVQGQIAAPHIGLRLGAITSWTHPQAGPGADAGRFRFDLPYEPGPAALIVPRGNEEATIVLPKVSRLLMARARAALLIQFLWALLWLLPAIWRWKQRGDLRARQRVKEAIGLSVPAVAGELPTDLFADASPEGGQAAGSVVIVMPIFNALDLLDESLRRVETHTDLDWHLVLIEDGSSDPRVRPFLRDWAAVRARVTLLENTRNLGFVASVNRGFDWVRCHAPERPVILLNSDVFVPPGWASRLVAPLAAEDVASVTPMANDAEILSVPAMGRRSDLPEGAVDRIDALARQLAPERATAELPTGIGFCMAIAPEFLARLPHFDPAFGRGYGEETDWCQRAAAHGGRHLGIATLFVEHRGGASFGSAEKARLLAKNHAEICRRYPRYDAAIQQFLANDRLHAARFALALAYAGACQGAPFQIWLAHAQGGGVEQYLSERIAAEIAAGRRLAVLRVGLQHRWQIELHGPEGVMRARSDDTPLMIRLLSAAERRHVIYACGVGDPDALSLPGILTELAAGQKLEIEIHDYFPISPSYTLLCAEGRYRGVPVAGGALADDPAHQGETGLAEWQSTWGRAIATADQVTVFSQATREIVLQVWPKMQGKIVLRPHEMSGRLAALGSFAVPSGGAAPVIGVLGNIGAHKGAEVVAALSADLARQGSRLVVIGTLDPRYSLAPPSSVHGAYRLADLPRLMARYGISAWLIPSIWPETFSYTTHEALATGLPVACFDLGAQAEAVRAAGAQGVVLPLPEGQGSIDLSPLLARIEPMRDAA